MKKSVTCIMIGILLMVPLAVCAAFSDVASEHWAAGYIDELTSKGVINGYTDGSFRPSNTLTKAEFIKLIISASLPNTNISIVAEDFNHWAADYVKVAENYGVLTEGEYNKSNIDEPITRIDVIRILSTCDINIRGHKQKNVLFLPFNDIEELTNAERFLLGHAVANEVIGGYPDGTFKPANNLTRAEASKILSVYMSK